MLKVFNFQVITWKIHDNLNLLAYFYFLWAYQCKGKVPRASHDAKDQSGDGHDLVCWQETTAKVVGMC